MTTKESGVYRILLGGEWFYIGSSNNLKRREQDHLSSLKRGDHSNPIMQNIYNQHQVFVFEVLELCPIDNLLKIEQKHLDLYSGDKNNINISYIAGSPMKGRKHSDSTRIKMSKSWKGVPKSESHKMSISYALKTSPVAKEQRDKLRVSLSVRQAQGAAHKGKPKSAEQRAKMSLARKKWWEKKREGVNNG